jgi:hypothetical protein
MDDINKGYENHKNITEKYNNEVLFRKCDLLNEKYRHETRLIKFKKFDDLQKFHLFTDCDIHGGDTYGEPTLNIQDDSCIL